MATTMTTKRNQRGFDDESQAMLYDGLNLSQLCKAFRMDKRDMTPKIRKCPPSGQRNGSHIWQLHEVAPYIVKPKMNIEEYLRNMSHNELPKHLTKEYWAGLRARQEYEIKEGDLWPTSEVVKNVAELMKLFSMSLKLMADTVDRQAELSDKQRKIILDICDSTSRDLVKQIKEKFADVPRQRAVHAPSPEVTLEEDEEDDSL